jgi:hypothetical protein
MPRDHCNSSLSKRLRKLCGRIPKRCCVCDYDIVSNSQYRSCQIHRRHPRVLNLTAKQWSISTRPDGSKLPQFMDHHIDGVCNPDATLSRLADSTTSFSVDTFDFHPLHVYDFRGFSGMYCQVVQQLLEQMAGAQHVSGSAPTPWLWLSAAKRLAAYVTYPRRSFRRSIPHWREVIG